MNLFDISDCEYVPIIDVDSHSVHVSVKGSLKQALPYWKSFCSDQFILNTIEFGYRLPFLHAPLPSGRIHNNKSAFDNSDFVTQAVEELLSKGCIKQVHEKPLMVNPLSVSVQSSGKKRLILDLRQVNVFLVKFKFKMEDLRYLRETLNEGDFLFKFDLKSGYHHVDIFEDHQTFLGFLRVFNGITKFFLFSPFFLLVCLPHLTCLLNF